MDPVIIGSIVVVVLIVGLIAGPRIPWGKLKFGNQSGGASGELAVFQAWCAQRDLLQKKGDAAALSRHNENLCSLFGGHRHDA